MISGLKRPSTILQTFSPFFQSLLEIRYHMKSHIFCMIQGSNKRGSHGGILLKKEEEEDGGKEKRRRRRKKSKKKKEKKKVGQEINL